MPSLINILDIIHCNIYKYLNINDIKNVRLLKKVIGIDRILKKFYYGETPKIILFNLGIDLKEYHSEIKELCRFLKKGSNGIVNIYNHLLDSTIFWKRNKICIAYKFISINVLMIGTCIKINHRSKNEIINNKQKNFDKKIANKYTMVQDEKRFNKYLSIKFRLAYSLLLSNQICTKKHRFYKLRENSII